jgi:outer membrane biosynthesis protein TonB
VVFGPRFLIQAGFIIAVAVVAGVERVGTWSIIGLVAAAWIVVALVEIVLWIRHAGAPRPAAAPQPEPQLERPEPQPVVVKTEAVPVRTPEPPRIAAAPPPSEPHPEPEQEQEQEPELEPEPEPSVAYLPISGGPREWNLWELERVTRDHATDDVAQNEERSYLLMYLREFAGPDGTLPADFDGLVRDAFGDLLSVVAT